jgi:hypothetical protein
VRPPPDPEARRWLYRRLAYYAALLGLFALIAFYVGPNIILFRKLTWLSPADFVSTAEERCVPIVGAIKEYERDHGRLPNGVEGVVPAYLPEYVHGAALHSDGELEYRGPHGHTIVYSFAPEDEGWRVHGRFANGPLPMAPVILGSSTRPTTVPH